MRRERKKKKKFRRQMMNTGQENISRKTSTLEIRIEEE